jgi:hypothetical protein
VKVVIEEGPPGGDSRLPSMSKVIPVRAVIERLQIKNGQVLYAWVRKPNRPTLWFPDIEATLENLPSRPGLTEGPVVLAARGTMQRSGSLRVSITADPFVTPLNFAGEAAVTNFDPRS